MKVGLFFGSFNPIHNGHLIVANIMVEAADLDEVWFVVSPRNPFKRSASLLHEFDRLRMVEAAIADNDRLKATDIEFQLPRPSYTVDTLVHIAEKYPERSFSLIIGGDNLAKFPKWKNYKAIMDHYGLYVYPRPGCGDLEDECPECVRHPNVKIIEAPLIDISATFIRKLIRENKSIRYLVPDAAIQFIRDRKLYI